MCRDKLLIKASLLTLLCVSVVISGCIKKRYKNITIEVQRYGSNLPLSGIEVELLHRSAGSNLEGGVNTVIRTAVTNAEGKVTFKNLAPLHRLEDYLFHAKVSENFSASKNVSHPSKKDLKITVYPLTTRRVSIHTSNTTAPYDIVINPFIIDYFFQEPVKSQKGSSTHNFRFVTAVKNSVQVYGGEGFKDTNFVLVPQDGDISEVVIIR